MSGNSRIKGNRTVTKTATIKNLTVTDSIIVHKDLTVEGELFVHDINVNGHIITAGEVLTAVLGATIDDTAGTTVVVEGNDTAGIITFTTGADPVAANALAEFTYVDEYLGAPKVVISPTNQDAVLSDTLIRCSQL